MLKVFATQVVVSRGYDGAAAIKFSEKGDAVRFRIGKKVYDPNAENNARWINLAVKGFGPICERIKKMQLKDGSFVNLIGRLDEDVWEDQQTHEKKSAMVIILDDIEYASGGGKSKDILARRLSGWRRMPGMRKRSGNMSRRTQRICRWSIRSRRTLPISLKTGISKIGC